MVLTEQLRDIVGGEHISTDADVLAARSVDWTGRYRGRAGVLVRPRDCVQVAEVVKACRAAGMPITVQGGRTSLVAGTVPEYGDVLLSTERLRELGEVDVVERQLRAGAGVTLADVQRAAAEAGLSFGVDLAARDSATVGGMAATNAGGLHTVRYGSMVEQIAGLEVVLPDGSVVRRRSRVRSDNTGYDLIALFAGAEGTLGIITAVDLRLRPPPRHRATALCGFTDLGALVSTGRALRDTATINALELIDGRIAALAGPAPVPGDWLLLVELAGDTDQTGPLAAALADALADALPGSPAEQCAQPAVAVDAGARKRLWQTRESITDVIGASAAAGAPPLKFDVALPLSEIAAFADDADRVLAELAPGSVGLLFGHVGEGNLHLNVLHCAAAAEAQVYPAMMDLIAARGGNVSSEHGVGSRKRAYLPMSREPADIDVMRTVKAALDPQRLLNPAVLFD